MSSPHLNYHVAFRDSDCPRHSSSTTSRLLNSELARKMMRDHVDGRDKNNNNNNNNKNVTHNNSGSHEDEHDDCTDLLLQYCHPRGPLGRDKDKDKDREDDRQPLLSPATSSDAVSSSSSPDPTPFYPSFLGSASSMLLSPLSSLLSGTAATAADADDAGDGNGDNSNNNNNNNNNNDNNTRSTLMEPSSSMPPPLQLAPPSSLPSTPRSKSTHSHSAPHPIHAKMQSFPSSRESQPQRPQTSESYQTQLRQEAHHEMERQQQLKERKNPKLSLPDPKHVAALPTPSVTTSTIAVASAAAMTPANNYNHNNDNHNSSNNNSNSNNRNENNPLPSHDCNYHHLQENAYEDFGIERKLVARQPDQDRDGVPIATPPSSHKKMGIMARDIRLGKRNKNAHKKEKGAAAPFGGGSGKGWWGASAKKQSRQQPSQQPQERREDGPDDRPRTPQMEHQQQQQQHKQYQEDKLQFPRPRTLSSPGVLLRSSHNNSGRSGNSGDGNNVSIHNTDNHGNDSPTNHHPHPWISMAGFHLKKTKSTPSKTLKSFRKSNNNNNDNECIDANNKTSPSRTSTTPHRKSYRNASPQTRNPPLKKNRAEGDTTLRLRSDRRRHSHHQDKCHQTSRNPNPNTTITTTRETGQLPNASVPVDIDEISIGSSDSERDGGYTYYSAPTEGLLLRHCCYDDDPYGMSPAVPSTAADVIVNVNANDTIATGNRTHDTLQGNRTKAHTHPSTHATGGPTRNHHLDTERVLSQLGMEVGEEDYCIEGEFGSRERMAKLQYHQHRLDSKRGHPRHHPHHRHGERNRHGATAANNNGQQTRQDDVRKNSNSNNNKNENQRSDKGVVPVQTMKKLARQTLESIRNRTHSEESGGGEAEAMQQHGTGIDKNKTYAVPSPTFKSASNHTKSNQEGNTTPKLIFGSKVLALLRRHRNKHNSSNSNSNNYTLDKVPHQIITIVSSEDEEGNEIAITPEEMLLVQRWQMARARREGKSGYYGGYDDSIALGDGDYKGPVDVDEDDYDDDDRDANIETSLEVGVGFPSPSPGDASFQSDHATYDSMYHVKSNEDVLSTTASSCDQTAIMDNRRRRRPKF